TLARWRGPSDAEPATSKTTSTRVLRVLTFWPPGPPLREKRNSSSPSGMTTVRETRRSSMISPPYDPGAEVPLIGDGVTQGIVRVGDTVRRPMRPMTSTGHAYRRHLQTRGFTGAPVPPGTADQGREVLPCDPGGVTAARVAPQAA